MFTSSATLTHEALIQDSWSRCRAFGLQQGHAPQFDPLCGQPLAQLLADQQGLLATTDQEVRPYYENILGNSSCLIRLADGQGRLLQAWGEQRLADLGQRPGFAAGACWAERCAGTNAIGTALASYQAVHVEHDEHFLKANRFMTGSAAPIFDHRRRTVAVLDVSSDSYLPPSHTLGMVRMMAQGVENRLIRDACGDQHYLLTFNTGASNLDSPWAGLLAVDSAGRIVSANRRADTLLGQALPGQSLESLFQLPLAALLGHPAASPFTLLAAGRNRFQCLLQPPRLALATTAQAPARPDVPVQADARVAKCLAMGTRLLDKDVPLLISGETGVGKEWLVKALHRASQRSAQPLVAVNCAAIPAELVESELFGYDKGAFTGAHHKGNPGLVRKAHKGILFLDEIADMPLPTQARLLRVLQERAIQPLGAGDPIAVDIRVICASHEDVRLRVRTGEFRQDLYYRLVGTTLTLPPLRERSDRRQLIDSLWARLRGEGCDAHLSAAVVSLLMRHPWPGNIRQLETVLKVAAGMAEGPQVEVGDLPEEFLADFSTASQPELPESRDADLDEMLQASDGNISQLARRLGVSRNTLYKRLRQRHGG